MRCDIFWSTLDLPVYFNGAIHAGKINIDSKEGMAVAGRLGVLDEGLPNIR